MRAHVLTASLALAGLFGGCASETATLQVWFRTAPAMAKAHALDATKAELIGSWNGWARPGATGFVARRSSDGTDWMGLAATLPEGTWQYAIVLNDTLLLDEGNPRTAFTEDPLDPSGDPLGTEVSEIALVSDARPAIADLRLAASGDEGLVFLATVTGQQTPDLQLQLRRGTASVSVPALSVAFDGEAWKVSAELSALQPGKYTATLSAVDGSLEPRSATAFAGASVNGELEDGLVYQVMVDRFRGPGALGAPSSPGDRAGGTIDGVREALEAGYFAKLGVTTLWLSPVYTNPEGRFPGRDGHEYESYHGYWPVHPRQVDPKLGGDAALDALIEAAHSRGVRVILDVVPNHLFRDHPYYRGHGFAEAGAQSWFNDGPDACVCGSPGCGWGEKIQTCWFADYLPDLDWRRSEVMDQGSADLAWWMQRFDLDGVRIDAVPMMPRAALRRMTSAVRQTAARQGLDALILGEVYTGPGDGGRSEIRAFLGTQVAGLDSAFDFPLMWSLRDALARDSLGLDDLEREVAEGEAAWADSGSTVARIVGNHDTTRFISEAEGDAGQDGWSDDRAVQPTREEPYRRTLMALTFALTTGGLPVLYYGDEVGLAGGGDPDSRRVMPDLMSDLPPLQAGLLESVGRLGRARQGLPALRHGARRVALSETDLDVALREEPAGEGGGAAIVVLARIATERDLAGLPDGEYRDLFSERRLQVSGGAARLSVPALTAAVFVRADAPVP
ncbi:MAG TPA: alpha-amylase family glycosyl hydrolase [Myxococcales bacterium]|jgi:glycosidase